MALMFRNAIFLSATLAITNIPGHSKLYSLEAKGNHFADISAGNAALKGANRILLVQRNIPPNDNLEKLAKEAQQLASEKEKQD